MSGIEATRFIRKKFSLLELPIMMLTAKGRVDDIAAGLEAGSNDYLPKPFDRVELLARVSTLIGLKNAAEESKKLNLFKQQLDIAREIQESTIPKNLPKLKDMSITARYIPMESVGGDFYDFHIINDNCFGVFIADVTGHGVPAALIASMVKIAFCILRDPEDRPDDLMIGMNRILTNTIPSQFVTAGYAVIDHNSMTLKYSRAGHEPIIIYKRSKNEVIELCPKGKLIGVSENNICECAEAPIEKGDRIVFYTDGITEVSNIYRDLFGLNFLKEVIIKSSDQSADDFLDNLIKLLRQWHDNNESFEDDATIVVIDVK
jgi:two-component system sensor histidine kinase ChiS